MTRTDCALLLLIAVLTVVFALVVNQQMTGYLLFDRYQ